MSHPKTPVIHRVYVGRLVEDSAGGFPADRTPTETCFKVSTIITIVKQFDLHSISSFGKRLNDKFLVLWPPSPHDLLRIRVNNRPNVVCNILPLSSLVMKRYSTRSQRFKDILYVDLWSARDAYMKITKREVDEFFQKLKHHFAR